MQVEFAAEHLGNFDRRGQLAFTDRDVLRTDTGNDITRFLSILFECLLLEIAEAEFHAADLGIVYIIFQKQLAVIKEVHDRHADEAGDKQIDRFAEHLLRGADLVDNAVLHDDDPVAQCHGLGLVMRDIHERRIDSLAQLDDLRTHLVTQFCIQVGQRLIHQEDLRVTDHRTADRDTLSLTAGQSFRFSVEILCDIEDFSDLFHLLIDLILRCIFQFQSKSEIIAHGHMRVQSVALENHGDIAVLRFHIIDKFPIDPQFSAGDLFKTGNHTECRGFSASGRSDKNDKFFVFDRDVDVVNRQDTAAVDLLQILHNYFCHVTFALTQRPPPECLTVAPHRITTGLHTAAPRARG